jgi:hydroxylamine dehydrogenase
MYLYLNRERRERMASHQRTFCGKSHDRRDMEASSCGAAGTAPWKRKESDKFRRSRMKSLVALCVMMFSLSLTGLVSAQECVNCHRKVTPNVVTDWQQSKHSKNEVECTNCHGSAHKTATDFQQANIPTPDTCAECHADRVKQFKSGKHAVAWAAMKALPTTHYQPMLLIEGMKGCGGCHKIGLKKEADIKEIKKSGARGFGLASCDACHTRHMFSVAEARQPQACQTCHMGFDHPQWEMYSSSKHGVRAQLKQVQILPPNAAAPTCQMCHMQDGNHGVRTAWGFLAVRLPMPEDKKWAENRATILKALGVLDPAGKPTGRLDVVKAADVARLTQEDWQKDRDKMLKTCNLCHSVNFAKAELEKGDDMIRNADALMAEAITVVAGLYRDGLLKKPASYAHALPDLLTFHDAPTVIEQRLFVMFLEHRMRAFQGTFHANPDYAFWYGWSEMVRDLTEVKEEAARIRATAAHTK